MRRKKKELIKKNETEKSQRHLGIQNSGETFSFSVADPREEVAMATRTAMMIMQVNSICK